MGNGETEYQEYIQGITGQSRKRSKPNWHALAELQNRLEKEQKDREDKTQRKANKIVDEADKKADKPQ